MIPSVALSCPNCKEKLERASWHEAGTTGTCRRCLSDFDFVAFPALTAKPAVAKPVAVQVTDAATCFFHAENQAETVCEGCGRFLCTVCAVPFGGKKLCASCIAKKKSGDQTDLLASRVLYGGIALALAVVPLVIYPFTLLTAPMALVLAILGWNKPGSLVRGSPRPRLVIAGVIALVEIGAWVTFFVAMATATAARR